MASMIGAKAIETGPYSFSKSDTGLMHTLFALEDIYGLAVKELDGEVCLCIDQSKGEETVELHKMLCAWSQATAMLKAGEISKDQYDEWRCRCPAFDITQKWAKVPFQELSDALVDELKKT